MSEFWVSRKKWTCPYCDITINDDVPSRMQHEGGLRHKGNVERALKDVYRKGERSRRDEQNAKREMKKIEKAALAAHAQDVAASSSTSASEALVKKKDEATAKPAWKPSDKLTAYSNAADLGLAPSEEETAEQKAAREEAERRQQEGLPGEWQVVASAPPPLPSAGASASSSSQAHSAASTYAAPQTEKDKARTWKAREKAPMYLDGAAESEALDAIKVRKRIKIDSSEAVTARLAEEQRHMLPQWRSVALVPGVKKHEDPEAKLAENQVKLDQAQQAAVAAEPSVRAEKDIKSEQPAPAEASPAPTESSMFKKRKAGTGAGAKRVRAV